MREIRILLLLYTTRFDSIISSQALRDATSMRSAKTKTSVPSGETLRVDGGMGNGLR
jgi:hypothetical protein